MENLIRKIQERIANATGHDRRYERPMDWGEADLIMAELKRLQDENKSLRESRDLFQMSEGGQSSGRDGYGHMD